MRLPITDKFLLDLYSLIQEIDKTLEAFVPPRTIKEAVCPEISKLRRIYEREKAKRQFSQFVYYLKKKGYIKIKNLEEKQAVLITQKGLDKVFKIKLKTDQRKKREDGKWQMVIFDIPEEKRYLRDILRVNLQILGYKMLQKSIWICPYEVSKETERILREYSLDQYVRIFLIEEIEV